MGILDKLKKMKTPESRPDKDRLWDINIGGNLHVNTGELTFNEFTWSPVHAEIAMAPEKINIEIKEALLCGIDTPGKIRIGPDALELEIMPNGRKQELESILPNFMVLAKSLKDTQFILAGIKSIPYRFYEEIDQVSNVTIVYDRTYDVLAYAHTAVVTSGTATLETALWDIPQVVIYRSNSRISI